VDVGEADRNAVVVTRHPPTKQMCLQALGAAGLKVRVESIIPLPPDSSRVDLMVVDLDLAPEASSDLIGRARAEHSEAVVFAVADRAEKVRLHDALAVAGVDHVLCKRSAAPAQPGGPTRTLGPDSHALFTAARRCLDPAAYGGVDAYLLPGARFQEVAVEGSQHVQPTFTALGKYLEALGMADNRLRYVDAVLDELLSNALHYGPRDADGKPRHKRTDNIELLPGEQIRVRFGCDGQHLAIAVSDPFGSVERALVVERLCAAAAGKLKPREEGVVSLSLSMLSTAVNQLIFAVTPGRRTEAIGLIKVVGSNREALEYGTSIHFH